MMTDLNKKFWTNEDCNYVIQNFIENENLHLYKSENRKYSRLILFEKNKNNEFNWIWEGVNNVIQKNLGKDYYLCTWIIGLKYEVGDYFLEHQDDYGNKKDRLLSGGIELTKPSEYVGGDYIVEGTSLKAKQGILFTHTPTILHEITELKKGTRYSLHFCIQKKTGEIL